MDKAKNQEHECHATECTKNVPPEMFMCKIHWYMVPSDLRNEIWRTYRPGQCDDKKPSHDYCRAAKAAVIAVAKKERRIPDTRLYDLYLARTVKGR